jgi:hypothetical protein
LYCYWPSPLLVRWHARRLPPPHRATEFPWRLPMTRWAATSRTRTGSGCRAVQWSSRGASSTALGRLQVRWAYIRPTAEAAYR